MKNSTCPLDKYNKILKASIKNSHKKSTATGYISSLDIICNELKRNYVFKDLKYSDIVSLITDWQDHYKNKTISNRLTILRKLTLMAANDGFLPSDPCEHIIGLKPDSALEEKKPFTTEEFRRMENTHTQCQSGKNLALLQRLVGLRIQEAIALCWSDINFKERQLNVRRSRTLSEFNAPKTKQSTRALVLTDEAMQLLKKQFQITGTRQAIDIKIQGISKTSFTRHSFQPVFIDDLTRNPFTDSKDYSQRFFTEFLQKAGIEHRGPSHLRHSFASIALSGGAPIKLISVMMGHVDTSVTEKHYAKWLPISDEDTRSKLSAALSIHDKPRDTSKQPQKAPQHSSEVNISSSSTWTFIKLGIRMVGLLPKLKPQRDEFSLPI
ncbi:tyrosine-type recombinase/integrase [Vibrio neonatus]|uniref:tyrosine-type recombinase/integrase n=1 Tax=Vibrio neonatus TaxID=278860 RepID=UPI0021C25F26|nr:site-specific integrase [Vibrio neonatus]